MLLDKLLDYMVVHSEPFATCLVRFGWKLSLAVVPHDDKRTLECGTDVQSERRSSPRQLATASFA